MTQYVMALKPLVLDTRRPWMLRLCWLVFLVLGLVVELVELFDGLELVVLLLFVLPEPFCLVVGLFEVGLLPDELVPFELLVEELEPGLVAVDEAGVLNV
jgi:hypothetical protein